MNEPTNNTGAPCTLDAVSLGPTGNKQGGYYFLNLTTGKYITHNHSTPYPMNKLVSCRVKRLRLRHSMRHKLNFFYTNRI